MLDTAQLHVHHIDDATRARASRRLAEMDVYAGSHRGPAANLVGALGEIAFELWLERHGVSYEWLADTRYDYRVGSRHITVEVKTKDRTRRPRPEYEASVPDYNVEHQRPDWYAFFSLLRAQGTADGFTDAYYVGALPADAYHRIATFMREGQVDPRNGTRFWTACWNVELGRLMNPEAAVVHWGVARHTDA